MTARDLFGNKIRVGILLFIGSEAVFFVFLITAYIYYHGSVIGGPTPHSSLDVLTTGFYTIVLLSSSLTVYFAERAFRNRGRSFRIWLGITIACGLVFLYGEISEYLKMLHHDVSISRNLFGSTYFTLTGFHAIHVTVGLVLLSILLLLSFSGRLRKKQEIAVESISYYWHFVDVVWVFVFSVVYLWSTR